MLEEIEVDDSYRPIDWVICGGESGPDARPVHPDWVRALRNQCELAGIPFFFKQWGHWAPFAAGLGSRFFSKPNSAMWFSNDGVLTDVNHEDPVEGPYSVTVAPVGKKRAGALLDGREHRAFPEVNR